MSALWHCIVYVLAGIGFLCIFSSAAVVALLALGCRRDGERRAIAHVRNLTDEELAGVLDEWAGNAGGQP